MARPSLAEDDAVDLSKYYGFMPLELVKLEQRSHSMQTGDFNHDGLTDIVLVDNSHSRIDLLQQRKEKPEELLNPQTQEDVNKIIGHWRYEHRKIPVDREVKALTRGDFNGDGRLDLAYFGDPDRLVVRYQPESGDWLDKDEFRLPDVDASPWSVAAGDLNQDGRADIAVLGENETFLLYQQEEGTLDRAEPIMNTAARLGLAMIADLNGDGRNDLFYLGGEDDDRAVRVRFQNSAGKLGAELAFDIERTRGVTLHDIDGEPGVEILTIDGQTGRVKALKVRPPQSSDAQIAERLTLYGFGKTSGGRDRDVATGDVDGDGRTDVVVTDPDAARVILFRQQEAGGLDLGMVFPSYLGVGPVQVANIDGQPGGEVVVISTKESTIGVSGMSDGRLNFPKTVELADLDGELSPWGMAISHVDGDERADVVVLGSLKQDSGLSKVLIALHDTDDAGVKLMELQEEDEKSKALSLRIKPETMNPLRFTIDGEKRSSLLLFGDGDIQPEFVLFGDNGRVHQATDIGGVRIGNVDASEVFVSGAELLVAQDSFARRLKVEDEAWQVVDQYNATEGGAKIEGVAELDLDGEPGMEVVLVDTGKNKLRILQKRDGLMRSWKEVAMGSFTFKGTRVADLNGDQRDDLLVFGAGRFGVLYAGQDDPTVEEVANFETKLDDVFFADVAAGDLNGDHTIDLAVMDMRSQNLEIVNFRPGQGLKHALSFKVYERHATRGGTLAGQPREIQIADVTNDGRADILMLSHDRVLVYPQDAGTESP